MNQPQPTFDAQAFMNKTIQELNTEERYQNFFKDYHPASVTSFITHYAQTKASWWANGESYIQWALREDLKWMTAAWEQMQIVQQKKLFDKQCLWRAEKETIEGVEICNDFHYWEEDILNCPFIDPISEKDIELYRQYLHSENVQLEKEWFLHDWQDYEEIKEVFQSENASRNFPEWYDFHNGRTGTGVYMTLPDIRGAKENVYIMMVRSDYREKNREVIQKNEQQRDSRPLIRNSDDVFYERFVSTFEDKQTVKYYKAFKKLHKNRNPYDETVDECLLELQSSPEAFPIEANADWRKAIIRATEKFKCHKIAEVLPEAYSEYRMRIDSGLPFERDENHLKTWKEIRDKQYENILHGRELKGEPRDLNF